MTLKIYLTALEIIKLGSNPRTQYKSGEVTMIAEETGMLRKLNYTATILIFGISIQILWWRGH